MDESLIELFKLLDSQLLIDYKNEIRTKIYKEIDRLRKKDDRFFISLEMEEIRFWLELLREHNDSNLKKLFYIYQCLRDLKFNIDSFKYLVNTN